MTIWICQNSTEKGGQSVSSGSKAAYTMRFPQTRKTCPIESPSVDLWTPLLKGRNEGLTSSLTNSIKRNKVRLTSRM